MIAIGKLFLRTAYYYALHYLRQSSRQRQEFRSSEGKLKIWGKEPEYIVAHYATNRGEKKTSLLLASGWWALARYDIFFHCMTSNCISFSF